MPKLLETNFISNVTKLLRRDQQQQQHQHVQYPSKDDAPVMKSLGSVRCNPKFCAATRTGIDAKRNGGAVPQLPLPQPSKPMLRQLVVILNSANHIWMQAKAYDDDQDYDGNFEWRFHNARIHKVQVTPAKQVSLPLSTMARPLPASKRTETPSVYVRSQRKRVSVYKVRYDRSVRVEITRRGPLDTFQCKADDTQFGTTNISFTPNTRISTSVVLRQAILSAFFPKPQYSRAKQPQQPSVVKDGSQVDVVTVSAGDLRKQVELIPGSKKPESGSSTRKSSGRVRSNIVSLKDAEERVIDSRVASESAALGNPKMLNTEAEYLWKDNRWSFTTSLEAFHSELFIRTVTNPWRVMPRLRVPLGEQNASSPWLRWAPEGVSGIGEVTVGWNRFAVSGILKKGTLSVSETNPNGSGFGAMVNTSKVAKVDKTIVTKAVKGKVSVTVNGSLGTQNDQTGINVSLSRANSSVSIYGRMSKSCGLVIESNFQKRNNFYHVGIKMDDFKSASLRLGVLY